MTFLNEIVWRDDAQVVEATICKRYSDTPSLKIIVRPLAPIHPSKLIMFGEEARA